MLAQIDAERARKELHAYVAKIPQLRTTKHEEIVLCELAMDAISSLVESKRIDRVVVGSGGRGGLAKLVLASVAEATVRRSHCPVLVVGPRCGKHYGPLKEIVFAADIPIGSLRAMSLAREFGGTMLTVTHVLPNHVTERDIPGETKNATETLRRLVPDDAEFKTHVRFAIAVGDPAEEIVHLANRKKAGLIVMGVREHGVLADHAPWATLSEVVRSAHCPVLAVQSHIV